MEATIQKWGNSQGVRLSKAILNAAHMTENDAVSIDVSENVITLRRIDRRRTLDDLFADYHGDYQPVEMDTGADVGLEEFD